MKKGFKFLSFAKKLKAPTVSVLATPEPTDADMLEFFRALSNAKPFRAAMLHYGRVRVVHGTDAKITLDAELNAYKQALAVAEEVQRKIVRRK